MERVERCHLCGQSRFSPITRGGRHFSGETVNLCEHCGLLFLSPRLTPTELADYYAAQYSQQFRGSEAPTPAIVAERLPAARKRADFLKAELQRADSRVLEVGCSCGLFLKELKTRGIGDTFGLDFSLGYTEFARKEYGLRVATGGFPQAARGELPFDLICLFHTFEHVADPNGCLEALRGLLKPGGALCLEVPEFAIKLSQRFFFPNYFEKVHLFDYSLRTLGLMCRKHGFRLKRFAYETAPKKQHHLRAVFEREDEIVTAQDFADPDAAALRDELLRKTAHVFPKRVLRRLLMAAGMHRD